MVGTFVVGTSRRLSFMRFVPPALPDAKAIWLYHERLPRERGGTAVCRVRHATEGAEPVANGWADHRRCGDPNPLTAADPGRVATIKAGAHRRSRRRVARVTLG
jgi:hypothetical protein